MVSFGPSSAPDTGVGGRADAARFEGTGGGSINAAVPGLVGTGVGREVDMVDVVDPKLRGGVGRAYVLVFTT